MAYFDQQIGMIGPKQVDYDTETVEGRVGSLLKTDQRGSFANPVVRQAVDRQDQAFNARGLRNSSMAVQGGTEAAISKALEIATPDANRYYDNRRSNIGIEADFAGRQQAQNFDLERQRDSQQFELGKQQQSQQFDLSKQKDTQMFQSRQDYQRAVQTIGTNFQRQLDTINASNMTPADKNVAIAQAQAMRDGEVAFQNALYSRVPQWQSEWLAAAVPTGGMDVSSVTNQDTLANITNDPAQAQAVRDAASAQFQTVRSAPSPATSTSMVGGAPAAGVTQAGTPLPSYSPAVGGSMQWHTPQPIFGGETAAQAYARYEATAGAGKMSPEDWYRWYFGGSSGAEGPGDGSFGGGGGGFGSDAGGFGNGGVVV